MALVEIKNLTFSYNGAEQPALRDINLSVGKGEFVVLFGFSGCGKTTLLRHLKPAAAPYGTRFGDVLIDGKNVFSLSDKEGASAVGFVMQDPDSQIVTDKVWHELAFGLESLGEDNQSIRRKVAEMASFFGIQDWYHKNTADLSGGQKQLLNLAAVMVMQPSLLILDEPTSRLDPIASAEFLSAVTRLNKELGVTVVITEHRLDDVLPLCTKCAVMADGAVEFCGTAQETGDFLRARYDEFALSMPAPMRVWAETGSADACALTVADGRQRFEAFSAENDLHPLPDREIRPSGDITVRMRDVFFKYEKSAPDVLAGLDLTASSGRILALIGGNGTGKSTLLSVLAGINKPYRGSFETVGRVSLLPQDPKMLFLHSTVADELRDVCRDGEKIQNIASLCGISHLLSRHPYDLSGGEQQKAALAKILLTDPDILLMDEPTKGLDAPFKAAFADILDTLVNGGKTVIIVSHDIEFCAEYADDIAMLFDGQIVSHGTPDEFFPQSSFYTTAASRIARGICPDVVTANDLTAVITGNVPKITPPDDKGCGNAANPAPKQAAATDNATKTKKFSAVTALVLLLLFTAVPATVYFGLELFGARRYLIVSLLVMAEISLPFVISFERQKPRARELIIIAVLCAIAIAGRAAFSMLPQFKPVLAIVIIAGASLGPVPGAFVGALTMLVSNMMFSQGMWTPWQMFAAGIIGFIAGLIFYGRKSKSRIVLCAFGIVAAVVIYGGIMNPASVFMSQDHITLPMLAASFVTGVPLDCIHGFATAFFLWALAEPVMEKLDRIKTKYGLIYA